MPKKSATTKSPRPIVADGASAGSQKHYDHFLPAARKIAAADVRQMRADVSLALVNAQRGVDAVLPHATRLRHELPSVSASQISDLPNVGLALAFAAGQVERYAPPPSDVRKILARAHVLRALLLTSADALASAGVLPSAQVAKIHQGHGGIDTAGDCVALGALFQKNAQAVRGKTPVSKDDVREAAEVGTRLLAVLQPKGARKKSAGDELSMATDARDRLWTLFERTWEDQVWRAGAWAFGRAVDTHVPPLQSRVLGKRAAKTPIVPAPATSGGA